MILVGGLPGSGKTTFAKALAESLGIRHINSDEVRAMNGLLGDYSADTKSKVYELMQQQVEAWIRAGESVVIDATFYLQKHREDFINLSNRFDLSLFFFLIEADEGAIRERVSRRRPYTEADFAVYRKVKQEYEPLNIPYHSLNSSDLKLEDMLEKACRYLRQKKSNGISGD